MRGFGSWLIFLVVASLIAWPLGMGTLVHQSIAAGHGLDWIMGTLAFAWLLILLKAPWDLFFQATAVAFELQRGQERGVVAPAGRAAYIWTVRRRLLALAVGAHLASAAFVALVTHYSGGTVGYYFAGFYLISTLFRPVLAGYVYLKTKLSAIGEESRYPREDVVSLLEKVNAAENGMRALREELQQTQTQASAEIQTRESECRELRQNLSALSREFETTIGRLTDNQEVIKGIQAFVRLIAQSTSHA